MLQNLEGDQFTKIKRQAHHDKVYDKWVVCNENIRK